MNPPENEQMLHELQRAAFSYFMPEANPANGLIDDRTDCGVPASIAATGLALSSYPIVKLSEPHGTEFLFSTLYEVPLPSASAAAFLGMWVELITPWLLGLGLFGRLTAVLLFVYNLIAVISYSALWPRGFFTGLLNTADFADHKIWALMLLAVIAWGPGKWPIDAMVVHLYQSRRNKPHIQDGKT